LFRFLGLTHQLVEAIEGGFFGRAKIVPNTANIDEPALAIFAEPGWD
jgi:hypothetical protein